MEQEAREQLENLTELIESHSAEMRALVKALFPEGVTVTGPEESGARTVRLEGIAAPNSWSLD